MTSTLTLPITAAGRTSWFAATIGFFLAFRTALTFLAFQSDPVLGSTISLGILLCFALATIIYTTGQGTAALLQRPQGALRWIYAVLLLSFFSLSWTGSSSKTNAAAYWLSMAAELFIVLLLLREGDIEHVTVALIQGFIAGTCFVALIAWCSPVTIELRLGNDLFLHPNTLGMQAAVAAFLAQFLARTGASRYKWAAIALVITLARTFSKTAILAYVVAEAWYLFANRNIPRRTKAVILVGALALVAVLSGVIASYLAIYNTTGGGTQAETLTGRTIVWATALNMAMEHPWLGHGMYSFRSLIPTFGNFLPLHAHNEWIHLFFELGVVGLAAGAGAYVSFYRQAQRARASELRLLSFALVLFTVLHSFTDTVPYGLSFPLWLMASLSIWLHQEAR